MEIYTSYYGNMRKLVSSDVMPISISLWKPKFFNGSCLNNVAPTKYMLSDACSHEEYLVLYQEILSKLNPKSIIEQIRLLGNGRDVALCCYEKPGDFCHRHLLAEWLSQNTEFYVREFGLEERKKEDYVQGALF